MCVTRSMMPMLCMLKHVFFKGQEETQGLVKNLQYSLRVKKTGCLMYRYE